MIVSDVYDLVGGELDKKDTTGHYLYVVWDGKVVFYVGQGANVVDRLLSHLGEGSWGWTGGDTPLGRLIMANLPESFDWTINLLTINDCASYLKKAGFSLCDDPFALHSNIDLCEQALIGCLHPCLNGTYNDNPTRLPEHYHDWRASKEELLTGYQKVWAALSARQPSIPGMNKEA